MQKKQVTMGPVDRLYAYLEIENWQTKLLPMLICTITRVLKASNLAWEYSLLSGEGRNNI